MPHFPAPTKYEAGQAVTISLTLEMLTLLGDIANENAKQMERLLAEGEGDSEKCKALSVFAKMVNITIAEPGEAGLIHGFCL